MDLKSMIKKNWFAITLFLCVIGYIIFITTQIDKSAKPETKTGPEKISVEAYIENAKDEICGDLFEDVEFSSEEAKNLQTLAKITNKKLRDGYRLNGPAETEYSYKNGKYTMLYSQSFIRTIDPGRDYIIKMLKSAFRRNEFSDQEIFRIADALVELRKECKSKKSSK